jgi:hypothetical protein
MYSLLDTTGIFEINPHTGDLRVQHSDFVTIQDLGVRFNITVIAKQVDPINESASTEARADVIINIIVRQHSLLCLQELHI